jgi:hypothetical protein
MNQKYDVFISYSRKDTAVANEIVRTFEQEGIHCFIDRQGIAGGMEFPAVLAKAIRESKVFLFLASKNSYDSKFTQSEIVYAFNKKQKQDIIPYIIDGSSMPDDLEFTFSAINWRRIEEHPIDTVLVDDVLRRLGRERQTVSPPPFPKEEEQQMPTISEEHTESPSPDSLLNHIDFSGKLLAQCVLGLSAVLFVFFLIFAMSDSKLHSSVSSTLLLLLAGVTFIMFVIGIIRPASICLVSRKEVFRYYLPAFFMAFMAMGAAATSEELGSEELSSEGHDIVTDEVYTDSLAVDSVTDGVTAE